MPRLQFRGYSCFSSSQGSVVLAAADSSLPGLFSLSFFSLHAFFLLCDSFESKAHRMRILSSQKVQLSNTLPLAAPVAISVTGYTIGSCTHGKGLLVPVLHRNCFLCSYPEPFPASTLTAVPRPLQAGQLWLCSSEQEQQPHRALQGLHPQWLTPKRKKKQLSFNGKTES